MLARNVIGMLQKILSVLLLLTCPLLFGQEIPVKISETDFTIGKSINIKSAILKETRTINVYLPLNYRKDSLKQYPVIYLLDGSKDEDFIHVSGIVQFGSFSWINMVPESIVVGIGNVDRKRDFTYPSHNKLDQKEFPTAGGSQDFIRFLEKELKPFIFASYRTTDASTIIGQSLGGLLATEILLKNPALFTNYIIVSPSLWWDDEKLLTQHPAPYTSRKSIYIAVGKEGEVMERTAKELYTKIAKNKNEEIQVFFEFFEDKTHGDALHNAVYNAFEKIFKP